MPRKGAPSNNPKGKPAGTLNKGTERARWAIAQFVDGNAGRLGGWLDRIAKTNPLAAFNAYMSVVEYHVPKLSRSEVDMAVKNEFADMPSQTLNILIESLKISIERDGLLVDQPKSLNASERAPDSSAPQGAESINTNSANLIGYQAESLTDYNFDLLNTLKDNERSDSTALPSVEKHSDDPVGGRVGGLMDEARYPVFPLKNEHTNINGEALQPQRESSLITLQSNSPTDISAQPKNENLPQNKESPDGRNSQSGKIEPTGKAPENFSGVRNDDAAGKTEIPVKDRTGKQKPQITDISALL